MFSVGTTKGLFVLYKLFDKFQYFVVINRQKQLLLMVATHAQILHCTYIVDIKHNRSKLHRVNSELNLTDIYLSCHGRC